MDFSRFFGQAAPHEKKVARDEYGDNWQCGMFHSDDVQKILMYSSEFD